MTLRLAFMGTPPFAVPTLVALAGQGYEIAAVYTQPPRRAGRGMAERRSAVHEQAAAFGLPVLTPKSLRDTEEQARFRALDLDAAIVVAYGLILPGPVLSAPSAGCLNLHASLLPRWRGAAPVQRAIMAGDKETGIMVMQMDDGLDTGPICLAERIAIAADETAGALTERLAQLGADLMLRAVGAVERGTLDCTPQVDEGAVYARKITKAEARIDWRRPAGDVHNHIRGLSPFPGAWCPLSPGGKADRVKILRSIQAEGSGEPGTLLDSRLTIACGTGAVRLVEVQRSGKKSMGAEEFVRGAALAPGDRLG